MAERPDAGLQDWETPRAGAMDDVVLASRANRDLSDVAGPWQRLSLDRADDAHTAARQLITGRTRKAVVQVRRSFFSRPSGLDGVPPAYEARSAIVAYLALLWLASGGGLPAEDRRVRENPRFLERPEDAKDVPVEDDRDGPRLCPFDPHTLRLSANRFGTVLGYGPPPETRAEKVRLRLVTLESVGLICRDRSPGPYFHIQLLHDSGNREIYTSPVRTPGDAHPPADQYDQLPVTLFTQGWAAVLSPKAVLAYLLILSQAGLQAPKRRLGPALRAERFPMTDRRFYDGRGELAWWGLVHLTRGGEQVGSVYQRFVYHRPVQGATRLRPRDVHGRIAAAGLATS